MTQATMLHSIFSMFSKYPQSSQSFYIHTSIPLFKFFPKVKKQNKTRQPNTMTSQLVNTNQNALQNEIYHMHSAPTL